jgi:ATP-dependent exoDNAse (exonuclease V) beta subunit
MVRRTLDLPIIKSARKAQRVFRDVPVAGTIADGRMQARIDLVFEAEKGWRLVDFKTDTSPTPDALDKHTAQMTSYAMTLSHVLKGPIVASVCLVRSGDVVEA